MRFLVPLGILLVLTRPASSSAAAPGDPVGARASVPRAPTAPGERAAVHVRFERLSPVSQVAEAQKDVLLGLLRETQARDALFLESDALPEGDARVLVVRCVSCGSPASGEALDGATISVVKPSRETDGAAGGASSPFAAPLARARFRVSPLGTNAADTGHDGDVAMTEKETPRPRSPEWTVDVDELRPKWTVRLRNDARQGTALGVGDFAVEACYVATACPGASALDSEADAFRAHDAFQGQEAVRALARGTALAPRDARPPLLVRPGDAVRVNVRTEASGLAIRSRGRALQAGARGEAVNVELATQSGAHAGRTLKAVVTAKGEVDYALE